LLRLGDQDHILVVVMHHIVFDGWSEGVLLRELSTLYEAYNQGEESPLPELDAQYADFAFWQREWLAGPLLELQLSYWRERLGGLEPLHLPTDRPRPAVETHRGSAAPFYLSIETTSQLVEMSRREGVTLFMTLLAGFQLLLSRYCGESDVAVAAAVANRHRPETEGLIGFFVNQLALRTDLSGDPNFRALLGRVRAVTLGAHAHQDLPFELLVEDLSPQRDLSRSPLSQVSLAFQNAPRSDLRMGELIIQRLDFETDQAKSDLTLVVEERGGMLSGALEYASDLFEATTITRLIERLRLVFERVVSSPDEPISEIEYLTPAERDVHPSTVRATGPEDARRRRRDAGRAVFVLFATGSLGQSARILLGELGSRSGRQSGAVSVA
jgi:hypothetical protein